MRVFILLILISNLAYGAQLYYGPLRSAPSAYSKSFKANHSRQTADSVFYNPATLSKNNTFIISHSNYFYEAQKSWMAVTFNNMAFGYLNYSVGDIIHSNLSGTRLGTFTYSDSVFFLAYQHKFQNFNVGFSAKHYTQSAIDTNTALSADLGVFFNIMSINTSIAFKNFLATKIGPDTLLSEIVIGTSYAFNNLFLGVDATLAYDDANLAIGLEYQVIKALSIAISLDKNNWGLGSNINFDQLKISYAYQPHNYLNIHEVSLTLNY